MVTAVQLDDELQPGTVEIHDEPTEHVLSAKLEPQDSPIPEEFPGVPFGGSRVSPQLVGECEFFPDRDGAERIHWHNVRFRVPGHIIDTTHVGAESRERILPFVPPLPKGEGVRG